MIGTWELPSTLPRGARTFLPPSSDGRRAVTRSALPSVSNSSIGILGGQTRVLSSQYPGMPAIKNGRYNRPFTVSFWGEAIGELAEEEHPSATAAEDRLASAADPLLLMRGQGHPAALAEASLYLDHRHSTLALSKCFVMFE